MHLRRIELTNFRQHKKLDVDFEGNMIAVLGKNGCLAEGTPVKMFDGTTKPVEEIKSGDVLLAFDDATGRLTSSEVFDLTMTSPSQKPKPMMEITINGEKTCTTYDHPFFAGDGFYPLYQLAWGALEERQRTQLKLLCEQYGAPFDDKTIWQQNSCCDEACAYRGVLQDDARWAYCEGSSSGGGGVAGKPAWTSMYKPFGLQSIKQQGGEPGVVQHEVQCVVWGNPWQHQDSKTADANAGGDRHSTTNVEGEAREISIQGQRTCAKTNHSIGNTAGVSSSQEDVGKEPDICGLRIEVLEAAPYYTIRMRKAPYTYCIGRRNCYLTHNCGKSNLIGAIQFALTGAQPGFTKADLTTWGEKEGSVKLIFTAGSNNTEFVIVRKTNGDVTMKVGGEGGETIKQSKKVEEALREKAGLDKDLINQIVFVPQKGIDNILFDDPKNREVAFQRLIGIGNASKIYDALRTEIAAYDKPQGFDEAIARSKTQLAEQAEIAKVCRDTLQKYESTIKQLPSKETLEGEVDRLAGAQAAIEELVSVTKRLESAQEAHERALKALGEVGSVSEVREDELRKSIDHDSDIIRFLFRLKELSEAAYAAKKEGDAAIKEAEAVLAQYTTKIEDDRTEVKRLDGEQAAAEAEARSLRNMMREASSDGTCPLCGAPATQEDISKHVQEKLDKIEATRKEVTEKARNARMALDKREAYESEAMRKIDRAKTKSEAAKAALQNAKDKNVEGVEIDMVSFEVIYKGNVPADLPKIEARLAENRRELAAALSVQDAAKTARDNVARYAAQVDMLVHSKQTAAKRVADMGMDPDGIESDASEKCRKATAKARTNLDAYNGILRDMAAEKGRLEAADKTIESTKKFIEDLVAKKELEDKVRVKVDTLKRVRDWFHYKEGPRIMSQNVMRDLTACVNSYLDQFNAPFIVEAEEEGFGFRCRFIDGRTMPEPLPDASLLSGGQKVALAIAFRMAIYMCFGGELGLLSLDEPTAYLDEASIEHLGELLQKVGEVARNKGLQILMATHEKAIMPFLDTKIDLGVLKKEE